VVAAARSACLWCSEPLPLRDNLNYCPFCGADVHKAPCPTCGDEVEEGWRFCASCGTAVVESE
jgi:predicted amidophosphoribosyltransferase